MGKNTNILERKVFHKGEIFIKAGRENNRAYVIQKGLVRSFVTEEEETEPEENPENGERPENDKAEKEKRIIEVAQYGPGTIIGEICLMLDQPINMSFEALSDTTVVTITRQDFEKKLHRTDKTIMRILDHAMNKLNAQDEEAIRKARKKAEIDEQAYQIVRAMTNQLPPAKQRIYENALLPHLNSLIKAIKELKDKDRHEKQLQAAEEKKAQILEHPAEESSIA